MVTILSNRSIISISGEDRKEFLQGLITNDINKVSENQAIYTFHLNPQGRFLYDFFIIENGGKLLLDVQKEKEDEILKKFSFYKLRSKIEIAKEPDLLVAVAFDKTDFANQKIVFLDPRTEKMGYRSFSNSPEGVDDNQDEYNLRRINLLLPDSSDFTADKSFPLEFGFENFNAIDYKKGCYVGQETTARMHYKSVIRKKIFLVEWEKDPIHKGEKIISDEKEIGEILSSIRNNNKFLGLALMKNLDNDGNEVNLAALKLTASNQEIRLI